MIFDPLTINNVTLPNRIVRSATAERIAMRDEQEGEYLGNKYAALAEGGVGLIISGHVTAHPSGRLHPSMPSIYTLGNTKAWRQALTLTHKSGGTLFIQLNHGGGRCRDPGSAGGGYAEARGNGVKPLCVSYLPERFNDPMLGDELSGAQVQELIKAFADSARKARAVGADGVQIHAAHGYLVSQFLSPLTNLRKDEWGGTLEGRANFLRSIIRAVRTAVGADFPLGVKLGACDDDPSGLKIEDTIQIAKWLAAPRFQRGKPNLSRQRREERLEEDGIDFIEISGGFRSDLAQRRVGPGKGEGYYLPFAAQFKKALKIPVFAVGGLRSLEKMNEALSLNQCDAVSMARPLICQPDLPLILQSGGKSECRGCNRCLVKHDRPTACYTPRAA